MNIDAYQKWRSYLVDEPLPLSEHDEQSIARANAGASTVQGRQAFHGDTAFDATLVRNLICTCGFYFQGVQSILKYAHSFGKNRGTTGLPFEEITDVAFSVSQALLRDDGFCRVLVDTFSTNERDCKEISATYFATCVSLARSATNAPPEIPMSMVTGLVFDERYAPDGVGHNWMMFGESIIDAAVAPDGAPRIVAPPHDGYIPIVSVDTKLKCPQMSFSRQMSLKALWTTDRSAVLTELINGWINPAEGRALAD